MNRILSWIKRNKLSSVLILMMFFIVISNMNKSTTSFTRSAESAPANTSMMMKEKSVSNMIQPEFAPAPNAPQRLVIQDSFMSLVVKNVTETQKTIIDRAVQLGGYMVNASIENPQDAANSTITVRIPATKLEEALAFYRKQSIKVVSENLQGQDVTDQYVDVEARMVTLQKTKTKFEEILDKSTQVADILNVQRELINVQAEIDALKGQKDYLEKSAQMAKITVYLSTDELSLPYAPTGSWRPDVIFKSAMSHLLRTFRDIGEAIIWIAVYSIVIVPVAIIVYYFWKKRKPPETKPLKTKSNIIH